MRANYVIEGIDKVSGARVTREVPKLMLIDTASTIHIERIEPLGDSYPLSLSDIDGAIANRQCWRRKYEEAGLVYRP